MYIKFEYIASKSGNIENRKVQYHFVMNFDFDDSTQSFHSTIYYKKDYH